MIYILKANDTQLSTMRNALEVYARLGMWQIDAALDALPLAKASDLIDYKDQQAIVKILAPYKTANIAAQKPRSEPNTVAWDLHQVIRHQLAWDDAYASGKATPDQPRDWGNFMGVQYDAPMRHSQQPLATITKE